MCNGKLDTMKVFIFEPGISMSDKKVMLDAVNLSVNYLFFL